MPQKTAPQGVRRPKHDIEFIRTYFAQAGCELLTEKYLGTKQELKYRCRCGKIGTTYFNNFTRSRRECQSCLMKKCRITSTKTLKKLVLREKLYCMAEAAMWLGVSYDEFRNEVKNTKRLPAPTRILPGKIRPYYNLADLQKIKAMIE